MFTFDIPIGRNDDECRRDRSCEGQLLKSLEQGLMICLPSEKPRKNLAAASPWKLWHAAMAMFTPPQITMVTPT